MTELKQYIKEHIIPYYNNFDRGHGPDHVEHVINESRILVEDLINTLPDRLIFEPAKAHLLAYTIAAYHDIGLCIDRENHHLNSGKMLQEDTNLRKWFTEEEITLMREAVEDHRASSKHAPRSIYGCIVAEADRDIDPDTILRRTIQFGLKQNPEADFETHFQRALQHMLEKYAEGGYIKLWLNSKRNEAGLRTLRKIIANEPLLREKCLIHWQNEQSLRTLV